MAAVLGLPCLALCRRCQQGRLRCYVCCSCVCGLGNDWLSLHNNFLNHSSVASKYCHTLGGRTRNGLPGVAGALSQAMCPELLAVLKHWRLGLSMLADAVNSAGGRDLVELHNGVACCCVAASKAVCLHSEPGNGCTSLAPASHQLVISWLCIVLCVLRRSTLRLTAPQPVTPKPRLHCTPL